MRALFIHRFCIRRCCDLPRRSACLALRTSSVETLRHRTCGRSRGAYTYSPGCTAYSELLWIAPAFRLSGLAYFLSGDLASHDLGFERRRAAPVAHILETMLWTAPAFPLSGLACFLSEDLAPQDLWNSKNIEKAAVLSPNIGFVFGDVVTCPGVSLVWPCVLPQWRPCVTGLVEDREVACSTRCTAYSEML
jgi:hypothetical protein